MPFFNTLKKKLNVFHKKVEGYQDTIAFSEAGIHEPRPKMSASMETLAAEQSRNLLVATHESRFSEDMINYALEMAARMKYGIIAVNAANITHDVTEFFSASHDHLFNEFKTASEKNITPFMSRAKEKGLSFVHNVHFANMDHAIAKTTKDGGNVEFIISENREPARARGVAENGKRIAQRLCVYSVN